MMTQHWLPEAELDRVMEIYDKNGNGLIEFDEFKSIVSYMVTYWKLR